MDYKELAIKYAKSVYDHTTGYSFKEHSEEVHMVHCMECDAEALGDDRTALVHKEDCEIGEVQKFLLAHGGIEQRK